MADKTASTHQEKAITTLDAGVEGMKLTMEENKAQIASMNDNINLLAESNRGLRQDFQTLMDWVKKEHRGEERARTLETGEGSSNIASPRSIAGNPPLNPQTRTRFGTISEDVVFVVSPNGSVNQMRSVPLDPGNISRGVTFMPDSFTLTLPPLPHMRPLNMMTFHQFIPQMSLPQPQNPPSFAYIP